MISSSQLAAWSRLGRAYSLKRWSKSQYTKLASLHRSQHIRHIFSSSRKTKKYNGSGAPAAIVIGTLLIYSLYPADELQRLRAKGKEAQEVLCDGPKDGGSVGGVPPTNAWFDFSSRFESFSLATDVEWAKLSDKVVGSILPEWSKLIPGYVRKLQRELSVAPGSLADEIWHEALDPAINPEIQYSAKVRVSEELCEEEKTFLSRRKKVVAVALAKYLNLPEEDVHPDDVPVIAMCGSGGGLRALVAGTGSLMATSEDGLFDCVTYTSGVSGSCWLQALYYSSITKGNLHAAVDHLKARIGTHIAYPPVAFSSVITAPTNKYLLSGMVEKLKGNSNADFGLVDVYGLLLAARLLVPKGELGVNGKDFKLSNQRSYVKYGQNPLPIYTAVRHEIPELTDGGHASEAAKEEAKQEAWFQWFEITPYEFFCEEFGAGIPTWAMGRKFQNGSNVPTNEGVYLPETRMPLLLGIFGSAFCATLSHYYREIRPLVRSLSGFQGVDELIWGRNEDLSKVHPINPATVPNFAYGMNGRLASTTPRSIYENEDIQLMDAGMSNNLPIYPLLRHGRDVEILVAFDASADIKTDNWLSVVDGYAKQRGIKGWPVGIGWPKSDDPASKIVQELSQAQAESTQEAESKLTEAKIDQAAQRIEAGAEPKDIAGKKPTFREGDETAGELGYCTVWVGSTTERSSPAEPPPPPPKAVSTPSDSWELLSPDAGITVVYLPFLKNEKVPGVDPATSDYMSTWNFVYTPEQVESVVALAKANYGEGRDQIRATVRTVYQRKKKLRGEREARHARERHRRLVRLGLVDKLGEGDHFS
ncbi:cytosolic phospholipase A2 zeta [Thozetella sp. PMI_491]|nr:cytosolic phospholipase A2 zeta [Thozetella sp. PMI_491]